MQLVNVGAPMSYKALPLVAEFPLKVQLIRVGEEKLSVYIPPPELLAEFPLKTQLIKVGEEV